MTDLPVADADPTPEGLDTLLLQVAEGDEQALERLYRQTSSRLFGICLRLLLDRSDAEDVLQEVYVGIWNRAGQFDANRASAISWLTTIARNKAIDRLRARRASGRHASIDSIDLEADPTASPDALAETAGERRRLDHCIERLEPGRKILIRTAFFDGATYQELATRSGTPIGTVKSWIRRGLMQLKVCLEQ